MARPRRPERNRAARSFRQLRRFRHVINSDKVFGTHSSDKEADIAKHPLLESYHAQFRRWLNMPRARLMVIGYSFADAHINKMIFDAIENGLKIFLIGPDGATTIGANKSFPLNPGPAIKNAIVGASSRPIRNTLSGNDMVELMKIERFFQDGRMAISGLNPAGAPEAADAIEAWRTN